MTARRRIGMTIRKLREARGWTQEQLAKKARVSQSYLSLLESGERGKAPSIRIALRLAQALDVNVEKLL
jgi:transcriptional regulator with XRE-family HTH domain